MAGSGNGLRGRVGRHRHSGTKFSGAGLVPLPDHASEGQGEGHGEGQGTGPTDSQGEVKPHGRGMELEVKR